MKTISAALAAHLAQPYQTIATCYRVTRTDGAVYGFTDHDKDITFESLTYAAATGYVPSATETNSALQVDNMEISGIMQSPSITEADLVAGLWDYAEILIFYVNYKDLTQGKLDQRFGHLGEVALERGIFRAELRGLTQAYTNVIGELCSPSCRYTLGDSRCTLDLAPFTVTGTITGVNTDKVTLYDSARTEPGPTGTVVITNVTAANPGVVTTDTPHGFVDRQPIMQAGIVGPEALNTTTLARNPTVDTYELGIDTSALPAYVSGGTAVALGSGGGYFTYGVITFDSGANAGLSREIKAYDVGQWTLSLPMPYPVEVGDAYTMVAGCDKSLATCRDTFANLVNFGGEPYLPGIDKVVQVARRA